MRSRFLTAALALLLPASQAASVVVVDDFSDAQAQLTAPATSSSEVDGSMLGGERDLEVSRVAGAGSTTAEVSAGAVQLDVPAGDRGQVVAIWDGDDDSAALDASGLGGVDLTAGGADTALKLAVAAVTGVGEVIVEVFTDAANSSRAVTTVNATGDAFLPFSAFQTDLGGGATFSNVGAIRLTVLMTGAAGTGSSLDVSKIETVGPGVSASKVDVLLDDLIADGKAQPGEKLRYDITIQSQGSASGVEFDDTVMGDLSFVGGTIQTTPLARDDAYTSIGNVGISVPGSGVLANDSDPDGSGLAATPISAFDATSLQGGTVSVTTTTGAFTYAPPAGFEGIDSFTYTIDDGEGNGDTGKVVIDVQDAIWFIDNTAGGASTGTLSDPFTLIGLFASANASGGLADPEDGDCVFLYTGTNPHVSQTTLLDRQTFVGQGATAPLASVCQVSVPPYSNPLPPTGGGRPVLTNPINFTLKAAVDNTIRGLDIGDTPATNAGISGTGVGDLTISDVAISGTGRAFDIVGAGNIDVTFDSVASTSSTVFAPIRVIDVDTASSFSVTGATTISGGARGIQVEDASSASFSFGPTSITGTGTGVALGTLTSNSGAIFSFASLEVASSGGAGLLVDDSGTLNIGGTANTASASGDSAVSITDTTIGVGGIAFASVSASGGASPGLELVSTGSEGFTVTGDGATAGPGKLDDNNGSGGTITGMTVDCVLLDNVNNVSLNYMDITDCDDNGVDGTDVNGFVLTRSDVTGHADAGSLEAPLFFRGLTGTADGSGELEGGANPTLIANSLIADGDEDNVQIKNETGTLARLVVRDSTIGSTSFGPVSDRRNSNDGINFEGLSSGLANAVMNLRVRGSMFIGNGGDHIQPFHNGTGGSMDVDILDNTMTDTQANPLGVGGGITINANDASVGVGAALTYDVAGNTIEDAVLVAIDTVLQISGGAMLMKGKIRDNVIGRTGAGTTECGSGSSTGVGIRVRSNKAGTHTVAITGNTIRNWTNGGGIQIQVRDGTGTLNVTVTGNTEVLDAGCIAGFLVFGSGLFLESGAVGGDTNTLCIDAGGAGALSNTLVDPNGFDPSVVVLQTFTTTMRFPTYPGAATNPTAHTDLNTFLGGRNSLGANGVAADPGQGPTFQGGITTGVSGGAPSTCPQP